MLRNGRGQSLVEFALIAPILLLLIMGTLDLGRVFYVKIALQSAAREGAYFVSYNGECSDPLNACYQDTIKTVQLEANNMGVTVVPADINVDPEVSLRGSPVTVTVSQVVDLFIFNFITGPIQVESNARMLVQ